MKNFALSLLIALSAANTYANVDDYCLTPEMNRSIFAHADRASYNSAELDPNESAKDFKLKAADAFEQAINNSAAYKLIILNSESGELFEQNKKINPRGDSGAIAREFLEFMKLAAGGPTLKEDLSVVFVCADSDKRLANAPDLKDYFTPGKCLLSLISKDTTQPTMNLEFKLEQTGETTSVVNSSIKLLVSGKKGAQAERFQSKD